MAHTTTIARPSIVEKISKETRDNLFNSLTDAINELTIDKKMIDLLTEEPEGLPWLWNLHTMLFFDIMEDERKKNSKKN